MKVLHVKVKPNSKKQDIQTITEGELLVYLKSPPTDGKANAELISLLAKAFGVTKADVRIKSGLSSRTKRVEINDDEF